MPCGRLYRLTRSIDVSRLIVEKDTEYYHECPNCAHVANLILENQHGKPKNIVETKQK